MTANQSYTTAFTVDQSPTEVFDAIINVRAWWIGDIEGDSSKPGAQFTYRYEPLHRSTQLVTEFVPGMRLVWRVTDAELSFVKDKTEWTGTSIVFDIARKGSQTEVRFTHMGLEPEVECYNDCSNAWGSYINGSLKNLIQQRAAA
jgi:hypothetical protein